MITAADYDKNIVVWLERQADLLRRVAAGDRVNDQIDWSNIAEEVEAWGKSERRELHNRIAIVLLHLIKPQASPATEPPAVWRETIREQRRCVQLLLDDSPSLRPAVPSVTNMVLNGVREEALASLADRGEAPRVDLAGLDYTEDQVLGSWLP
jgi:Domain of unknown function DUF29